MAKNKKSKTATDNSLKTSKNPQQKTSKSHHRHPSPPKIYKDFVIPYIDYFSTHPASSSGSAAATSNLENGKDVKDSKVVKRKMTAELNQKSAKRSRLQKDSKDVGHGKSTDKKCITENERQLEVLKQIEKEELQKTRNEIQKKLLGNIDIKEERISLKEQSEVPPPLSLSVVKSEPQCHEFSSASDIPRITKNPTPPHQALPFPEVKTEFPSAFDVPTKTTRPSPLCQQPVFAEVKTEFHKPPPAVAPYIGFKSILSVQPQNPILDNHPQGKQYASALNDEVDCVEQLNEILLSRRKLALLSRTNFFEKTVLGCFVKIQVGKVNGLPVSRVAQITEVVHTAEVYKVEFIQTKKALKLKHASEERIWRLNFASHSEFTNNEYFIWRNAMKRANLPLPTAGDIEKKKKDIKTAFLIMNAQKRNRY